eukprot:m.155225 g.155225  ORF g.155225 m.155225 type:complete len:347 (+) comp30931_c0_seq6:115-1155(+)
MFLMQQSTKWLGSASFVILMITQLCNGVDTIATHHFDNSTALQYFSVWDLETATPQEVKPFSNFLFTCNNASTLTTYHTTAGISSLFDVQSVFFCKDQLCPDYATKWASLYTSTIAPMLHTGVLFGVFFGDELGWQCISWGNISAAVDMVRSDLPRGKAILYYNEAYPVFTDGQCDQQGDFKPAFRRNYSYPSVPTGLDWVSIDYYPDEGTAAGVQPLFEKYIYPKMTTDQRVLFVPPAYGSGKNITVGNQLCCSNKTRDGSNPPCNGNCSLALAQWAVTIYDWARADPKVIGLNPWHWNTRSMTDPMFEPGLTDMPQLLSVYKAIGAEIVSGRLGDIRITDLEAE